MSIITLTTDYGNKDYSVSELKAKIYNEISDVRIVDVSHNISPFNLTEAAYIIKSAYRKLLLQKTQEIREYIVEKKINNIRWSLDIDPLDLY